MPLILLLLGFAVVIVGGLLWNEMRNRAAMESEQADRYNKPRNAIRKCFREYREARLGNDPGQAVKRIDTASLRHFEKLRDLAFRGTEVDVRALSPSQRLHVLMYRALLADQLESSRGGFLFAFLLQHELVDKDRLRTAELGQISIDGDQATAPMQLGGRPAVSKWTFRREGDVWRLHYPSVIPQDDLDVNAEARRAGVSENEWIEARVATATGTEVSEQIWQPLRDY